MNILITAIGSFSADCVINTLKKDGHQIIGCDIYPSVWHAASKDCHQVYQAPFSTNEEEYISFLLDVCRKERIECIFPLTDLEIDVLNRHREEMKRAGVLVCMQSPSALNIARDKYALFDFFKEDPIVNVPDTVESSALPMAFPLPAIAKPKNGRSSEGLRRIQTTHELELLKDVPDYVIQETIEGPVFTVDYIRDDDGADVAIPREELLRTKNGAGTTVRIIPDLHLQETASHIGSRLGIIGCINMEFIFRDEKYYLIDINPRFSAGVAFSNFTGYDMVTAHLNCFINKRIPPRVSFEEQIICKRYQEELLWISPGKHRNH